MLKEEHTPTPTHPHTHTPTHFGVPPHSHPAAEPPSREGYKKPGQDGGQLPAAEVPVPTSQLLQEQLGICLGHGSGSVHLTAGQRREKVTSTIPAASAPLFLRGARMRLTKRKGQALHVREAEGERDR